MAEEPENEQNSQFGVQKIYLKDSSFETPHSPQIFQEQWNPKVNMDITNTASRINNELHEIILSVTVTVSFEEKTVYLVEVQQAGIFHISGLTDEVLGRMLATVCPNILFPFAREFIADLVRRGGFPQLLLAPVNFDALYMQQQQQNLQQQPQKEQAKDSEVKH